MTSKFQRGQTVFVLNTFTDFGARFEVLHNSTDKILSVQVSDYFSSFIDREYYRCFYKGAYLFVSANKVFATREEAEFVAALKGFLNCQI